LETVTGTAREVRALELANETLYFGGLFATVAGVPRKSAAAVDAASGALRDWDPQLEQNNFVPSVDAIAVAAGRAWIGGFFSSVRGAERRQLVAVDATSGALVDWDPGLPEQGVVTDLHAAEDRLYVAGSLNPHAAPGLRGVAAFDAGSGALRWSLPTDDAGFVLRAANGRLFAGGRFHSVAMEDRPGLAALDATSGEALAWSPAIRAGDRPGSVSGVTAADGRLYVFGAFDEVGDTPRPGYAAFDLGSHALTDWEPQVQTSLSARGFQSLLGASADAVYIAVPRASSARQAVQAVSPATGEPLPFRAEVAGDVTAVQPAGGLVYIGYTPEVVGQLMEDPAFLTARRANNTGRCWTIPLGGSVDSRRFAGAYDLEFAGSRLYVGGHFTEIAGVSRNHLAVLDPETGKVQPWNARASEIGSLVEKVVAAGPSVFVAGIFSTIGGAGSSGLSELRASDATATGFAPPLWGGTEYFYASPSAVQDMALGPDGILHVGGSFSGTEEAAVAGYAAFAGAPSPGTAPRVRCPDTTPPRLRLAGYRRGLARALRRGVTVSLHSNEAARVRIMGHPIKAISVRVPQGKKKVQLSLTRRTRRALRDERRAALRVKARARDREGNTRVTRHRLVLKR
jgi:outer membrane protein assembly factor BamB